MDFRFKNFFLFFVPLPHKSDKAPLNLYAASAVSEEALLRGRATEDKASGETKEKVDVAQHALANHDFPYTLRAFPDHYCV